MTIHRSLEFIPSFSGFYFNQNIVNPLFWQKFRLRFQPESTFSFVLVESVKDIVFISMLKFKHGFQG